MKGFPRNPVARTAEDEWMIALGRVTIRIFLGGVVIGVAIGTALTAVVMSLTAVVMSW